MALLSQAKPSECGTIRDQPVPVYTVHSQYSTRISQIRIFFCLGRPVGRSASRSAGQPEIAMYGGRSHDLKNPLFELGYQTKYTMKFPTSQDGLSNFTEKLSKFTMKVVVVVNKQLYCSRTLSKS